MKSLYLIALFYSLVLSFTAVGQTPGNKVAKGNPNKLLYVNGVDRDTCLNKKFSIVFYVIQDSTQKKDIASVISGTIPVIMKILNDGFTRLCVTFQNCSTVVIPNYSFNTWNFQADGSVTSGWYTKNVINIYLIENIDELPEKEKTGYAHAPNVRGARNSTKDVIVLQYVNIPPDTRDNSLVTNAVGVKGSPILHIMGHFFGLPDTYANVMAPDSFMTREKVRRTNCDVAGDGFCDTEADPYEIGWHPPPAPPHTNCHYYPNYKDLRGDYFTPPVDNIMSMYSCRCRFTQQQYNHMARFILTHRMHLH